MVKPICKDVMFLSKKAEIATAEDIHIAEDLLDTLKAHREGCVGMAANMIGINKAIIVVSMGLFDVAMLNPKIVKRLKPYEAEEGCLSLTGTRKCQRYDEIEVEWQDMNFNRQRSKYTGWIAEIIQHEIDHLNGVVI
ncbi:MAG: peptide deformylase [Lachnospiraceae bacterium]|nr:peptide deformylase [Lachnospiraceae bacterium]